MMPHATLAPQNPADTLGVLDDPVELQRFTRFDTGADGRRVADSALRITGMVCAACAGEIEQAVARLPGVQRVSVSAAGERARVHWDPSHTRIAAVIAAIQAAGYGAEPDAALASREARRLENRSAIWRLFVAAFCAMQVMMLATPRYVA
ncbi:MAG: heavy metal translocating P-type ATPase, partial [Burkholderiales bacterium PBB5]